MSSRLPSWRDIRRVVEFKTFYLALVLALIGIVLLFLEEKLPSEGVLRFLKDVPRGVGLALVTSAAVSVLTESALRLDIIDLITGHIRSINRELLEGTHGVHPDIERYVENRADLDFLRLIRDAVGEVLVCGVSANDFFSVQQLHQVEVRLLESPQLRFRVVLLNCYRRQGRVPVPPMSPVPRGPLRRGWPHRCGASGGVAA